MRKIGLLLFIAVLPCLAQNAAKREIKSSASQVSQSGRYQLHAVKALAATEGGGQAAFDEVFILDTSTGRVWKYEPYEPSKDKGSIGIPAGFQELVVDNLNGDSRLAQLQRIAVAGAQYQKSKTAPPSPDQK